jgi:DNA repair exonuclease SbcCD ATPase subunit
MKTIKIKSLALQNFKGIRNLHIADFGQETNIFGANASGKTTVFDAFTWLLFGKDSTDRQAFEVKTLDKSNNPIPQLEHSVTATLEIDGEQIDIQRTLREKWVKQRGALEATFQGNEQAFFWNGVPMQAGEFAKKVSSLMDEKIFKLITNPLAFNAMKWQDQRAVLMDIAGNITDKDLAKGNSNFEALLNKLSNKSLDEYKKQVAAQIKKAKDELKMLPTRIDEVERGKPQAIDFDGIKHALKVSEIQLNGIDDQITDRLKAQQAINDKKAEKQQKIYALKSEISSIEHNAKMEAEKQVREAGSKSTELLGKIKEVDSEIQAAENGINTLVSTVKSKESEIEGYKTKQEKIRKGWMERNAETFKMDENDCKCPTCKREYDADDIAAEKVKMEANFKFNKQLDLDALSAQGKSLTLVIENLVKEISGLSERIENGKKHLEKLVASKSELETELENDKGLEGISTVEEIVSGILGSNKELPSINQEIQKLEEQLNNQEGVNVDDLKSKKAEINARISELKTQLQAEEQIKKADERIAELMKMESELAQQIADVEREQFTIENFIKAKIDRLEAIINEKFAFVNFKMFETQINGGEVETCKALVDGVPFSDANNAAKINAGIDIINTLCEHYQVSAPIFVDNRESVSRLIDSKSQIINLIVSEADAKLRIEAPEMVEAV